MKNIFKDEKGITLIALVITLIVMLILVVVTIKVAVTGNLFTYAGNAVKETKKAVEEETAILDAVDIDEIIAEHTGNSTQTTAYPVYRAGTSITVADQNFIVIENSNADTSTVKLITALCVDTRKHSPHCNEQTENVVTTQFDSTDPYTNIFSDESCSIKGFVEVYVDYLENLGLHVQEGRLMTLGEVEALGGDSENTTTGGCRGDNAFVNDTNYWLMTPASNGKVWAVDGTHQYLVTDDANSTRGFGLRPVIVIPKSDIPAQQ